MQKNQIIELAITSISSDGSGVGKYNTLTVFVPQSAVGDILQVRIVKVLKNYCFGKIEKILTPSPSRIDSSCAAFQRCGGCCYRHIDYGMELQLKKQLVEQNLKKIAGIVFPCEEILFGKDSRYRNKAQYPVGKNKNGKAVAGFYAKRSHQIIPCNDCQLQENMLNQIMQWVLDFVNTYAIPSYNEHTRQGLLRHIFLRQAKATGEIMLCLVVTSFSFPHTDKLVTGVTQAFPAIASIILNRNAKNTNVITGEQCKCIYGKEYITDVLCGLRFQISPLSFFQINPQVTEKLYNCVREFAQPTPEQTLLDLYCGAGTIGLSMAHYVKQLIGVEIIPQAIENAKQNACINQITNASFICADAGQAAQQLAQQQKKIDIIIVDPPRKGCDTATLNAIIKMAPEKVVMVSCNSATMARDVKVLTDNGYVLTRMKAADMFPRSAHVEAVCLLQKIVKEKKCLLKKSVI